MRIPRFVLAILLVGTPVATIVATASVAFADPFTYSVVDVGNSTVCAVTTDGTAVCFGNNRDQYLISTSRETTVPSPTKVSLPNNDRFVSLDGGANRTWCGLATSGKVYCWGDHHIGSYLIPTSRTPVAVEFPHEMTLTEVRSGYALGCALNTDGELWCWGDVLESGSGQTEPIRTPVKVAIPSHERVINFDIGGASCAVTDAGNIYCWGHENGEGQLGIGYTSTIAYALSVTPQKVLIPSGVIFVSVTTGNEHSCALSTSGTGYCWGDNYQGLYGNDSYADSRVPVPMVVPDGEKLALITTGWYHTCVLTVTGKTWCFGRGDYGELGTGTTLGGKTYRTPLVPTGTKFTTISAALGTTCAIDQIRQVWCWGGLNWGTSGNGNIVSSLSPTLISPVGTPTVALTSATDIDAQIATIRGTVNANGHSTRMIVDYSTSQTFANFLSVSVSTVLRDDNFTVVAIPVALNDLLPCTTYYARMTATNDFGATTSNVITFTTLGTQPTVSHLKVSDITGNESNVSVSVNPGRLLTTSVLEYSTNNTFSSDVISVPLNSTNGSVNHTLTASLSELHARTTYYTRVTSTNQLGSTTSLAVSFTTTGDLSQATVSSTDSSLTSISAVVTVDTGHLSGTVYLEVSTQRTFTDSSLSDVSTFLSGGPTEHSLTILGLSDSTTYYVRAVATNELGSDTTAIHVVRTAGAAPVIGARTITPDTHSAELSVHIDTTGLSTVTIASVSTQVDMSEPTEYFLYSDTASGQRTITMDNLLPRITYYLQVTAANKAGAVVSPITQFTTTSPIGVIINNEDETTESPLVSVLFTPPPHTVAIRISNYKDFKNARVIPTTTHIEWKLLEPTGSRSTRTVWVQFILPDGKVRLFSDSIDVLTDESETPVTTTTVPNVRITRSASVNQPIVISATSAPVRSAIVASKNRQPNIARIQTKVGKKISTRNIGANKSGKYIIVFPKGISTLKVRFVTKSGLASPWSQVSAP